MKFANLGIGWSFAAAMMHMLIVVNAASGQQDAIPGDVVEVRQILQIGRDLGPPEYTFGRIAGLAVSEQGDIYLVAGQIPEVRRYNKQGEYLNSFGREGPGPGEFSRPVGLSVQNGVVIVNDLFTGLHHFTLDGDNISAERLESIPGVPVVDRTRLKYGLFVSVTTPRFTAAGVDPGNETHDPNVAVIVWSEAGMLDTIAEYPPSVAIWYTPGRPASPAPWGLVGAPFGAGGAWAVSGDSVLVVIDGYASTMTWYGPTPDRLKRTRVLRLGLESCPFTDEDMELMQEKLRQHLERREDDRNLTLRDTRLVLMPQAWSVVQRAFFSESDALWVDVTDEVLADDSDGNLWFIYDPGASSPRRVAVPEEFGLVKVQSGRLYGTARTEFGAPVVRVYEFVRR